jgi:hypothetical protein
MDKLKFTDCKMTLLSVFDLMRALPREKLINAMLQVALRYFDAVCPSGTDGETKQVLAVYEISELLREDKDFFTDFPDEAQHPEEINLQ